MLFNCPLSPGKADRLIQALSLSPSSRIVDIGCGTGEFLIRCLEASGASGLGLDINQASIQEAKERASGRIPPESCTFQTGDIRQTEIGENSFHAALCLGSTHAFGMGEAAYPGAIHAMTRMVRPGGRILIGEGYWKQDPDPQYLELIGDPLGIYRDHRGNVTFAEEHGLTPLYAVTSNTDEWDHFEWSHRRRIEEEAAARPGDTETARRLEQSRAWRDGYLRWGRETMGFGFYLFSAPGS